MENSSIKSANRLGLTLEDLADGASVDDDTVDNWMYHGSRPSDDNLKKIAEVLSESIEGSAASGIAIELRALYWISDMGSLLAERIGQRPLSRPSGDYTYTPGRPLALSKTSSQAKNVQKV